MYFQNVHMPGKAAQCFEILELFTDLDANIIGICESNTNWDNQPTVTSFKKQCHQFFTHAFIETAQVMNHSIYDYRPGDTCSLIVNDLTGHITQLTHNW